MSLSSKVRVLVSIVLSLGIVLVMAGFRKQSWDKLTEVERKFADERVEIYRLADYIRAQLKELTIALVNYNRHQRPEDRIHAEAVMQDLQSWLAEWKLRPRTPLERNVAAELEAAYNAYAARLRTYLAPGPEGAANSTDAAAVGLLERLQAESANLFALTDRLEKAQRKSAEITLAEVHDLLLTYRSAFVRKSMLFAFLGAALAAVVYLGLFAPLREVVRRSRLLLERQEKLAALSTLVAGLAHEIRNPLNSISARLYTQAQDLPQPSEAFDDNRFIVEEIGRLDKIVKEFLRFARPGEPSFEVLSAAVPFRELAELMEAGLKKNRIGLETSYAAEPLIRADRQQLKQALLNLARNAAEAVGQDGTITFRTRLARPGRGRPSPPEAVLEVADTGPGIPRKVQARLFDPFFTTKPAGTGLGLSISARIVEAHGGRLEYDTRPGSGSIFRVLLPVANPHEHPTDSTH